MRKKKKKAHKAPAHSDLVFLLMDKRDAINVVIVDETLKEMLSLHSILNLVLLLFLLSLLLFSPLCMSLGNLSNHLLLNVNAFRRILLSPVNLDLGNSVLAKINRVAVLSQNICNH